MVNEAKKRYALVVMTAVYMLSLLDRGLINLLMQPIKEDLHLSDTQLGLVTGIAFGLFYATLGIPIARWADRGNRVTIAALSIGLWGVTMMACLFVTSYVHLVIARIATAVGEAGGKPPTYSLIGDYFPKPVERTRAMAFFFLGSPTAALTAFIIGGWLNELYGWRITFLLVGIPGLALAALVKFTITDPRVGVDGLDTPGKSPSIGAVLNTLWCQRSCRHLTIALILVYTMGLGLSPWYAAFMVRSHGLSTAELGVWFGLIFGFGGMAGVMSGGYVATRWFADSERSQMRSNALVMSLKAPVLVLFLLIPNKYLALAALATMTVASNFFYGPIFALLQRLVGDEMRTITLSVVMLLANLIGMGVGPLIVGILSDALMPALGDDSLRYSMLTMSLAALWAAFHFWCAGRTVGEDLAAVQSRAGAPSVEKKWILSNAKG